MAEVIAGLELAGLIISFIELGVTVADRLKQFHDQVDNVPDAFRSLKNELPLTTDTLERTLAQAKAGHLSVATTRALTPLVESCLDQIKFLDGRLDKLLPSKYDTGWERTLKALKSVYQNADIQESVAELHKYILLLAFHQATCAAEYGQRAAAQTQLKMAAKDPAVGKLDGRLKVGAVQDGPKKPPPNVSPKPEGKAKATPQNETSKKSSPNPSPRPKSNPTVVLQEKSKKGPKPGEKSKGASVKELSKLSPPSPGLKAEEEPRLPSTKHQPTPKEMCPKEPAKSKDKTDSVGQKSANTDNSDKDKAGSKKDAVYDGKPQQVSDKFAWTPLHEAAKSGDDIRIRALLAQGANVDTVHRSGTTPLITAARWRHVPAVLILLENGARIDAVDEMQKSALTDSAQQGNDAMVKLLLDRGARVNPLSNSTDSALHKAARNGHYTTVELLLDRGANIDAVNKDGWTPLHNAAGEGRKWTSKLLLDRGANARVKDGLGLTPFDVAIKRKHERVVDLLTQHKDAVALPAQIQSKERWERLDKSPVRIVFKQTDH